MICIYGVWQRQELTIVDLLMTMLGGVKIRFLMYGLAGRQSPVDFVDPNRVNEVNR